MNRLYSACADILLAWLVLTFANLANHHLLPIDETRYAAVAWEMWYQQDFLVPHLNGEPYHHKPPLLFWLYHLGWAVFGVNELWVLLISPFCALIALFNVRYLAVLLWPQRPDVARLAPWILLGSLLWSAFLNAAMFDTLLTVCVLLALTGLLKAARHLCWNYWGVYALGCGLGLLAKGPVVFVHSLIPFLTAPLWSPVVRQHIGRWYWQGSLAILAGIALALCWVIPAISAAGDGYGFTLLWHQTANRMSNSFAHKRVFWWYLMWSPVLLFPWILWPKAWRYVWQRANWQDLGFRFCLIWFVSGFLVFSMISGKQAHYLVPLLPALALLLARSLPDKMRTGLGDYLPFLIIALFGLALLVLPVIAGIKPDGWILHRKIWWALLILLIGVAGMFWIGLRKQISACHLSITVLALLTISLFGFFASSGNAFHLQQAALVLQKYQNNAEPIAWVGGYHGQFQFLLRRRQPMPVIEKDAIDTWLQAHPRGHVIYTGKPAEAISLQAWHIDYQQAYKGKRLWVLSRRHPHGLS